MFFFLLFFFFGVFSGTSLQTPKKTLFEFLLISVPESLETAINGRSGRRRSSQFHRHPALCAGLSVREVANLSGCLAIRRGVT